VLISCDVLFTEYKNVFVLYSRDNACICACGLKNAHACENRMITRLIVQHTVLGNVNNSSLPM
jgi:hypothetical protein